MATDQTSAGGTTASEPAWGAKVPGNGAVARSGSVDQPRRTRRPSVPPGPSGPPSGRVTPGRSEPDGAAVLPPPDRTGQARRRPGASSPLGRPTVAQPASSPPVASAPAPERRPVRRGRRVKRIVRRIELWSVLKLCLVLYACLYAAVLLAVAGLWGFLNSAGLVDRFESFMRDIGFDRWEFHGADMFRAVAMIGAILVLAGTILTLLVMSLVNVVSELTGGIRFTVIEEEMVMVAPQESAKTSKATKRDNKAAKAKANRRSRGRGTDGARRDPPGHDRQPPPGVRKPSRSTGVEPPSRPGVTV